MTPHRTLIDSTIVDPAKPQITDPQPYYDFLLPSLLCLSLLTIFILIFVFRRKSHVLSTKLISTENELRKTETELCELKSRLESTIEFQKSLKDAEITTKLQKTRLSAQTVATSIKTPERYRYVKSLADSGMAAEEIAGVLSISPHEAAQLVTLSRLAGV